MIFYSQEKKGTLVKKKEKDKKDWGTLYETVA